jgi:hypothetical protein
VYTVGWEINKVSQSVVDYMEYNERFRWFVDLSRETRIKNQWLIALNSLLLDNS